MTDWLGNLRKWVSLGLDPELYWSVTPGNMLVITSGVQDRLVREYRSQAWAVWHTVALGRMKKLPKMDKLFPRREQKRRRTWQEQMAVMDQWIAATRSMEK